MREAMIFNGDRKGVIVTADEVKENHQLYSDLEFVDPEYEFRVKLISDCKGHNGPYFRYYLTREEYADLSPERKSKFDILRKQSHYQESEWHRYWKEKLESYGKTEYLIKNPETGKYKRTDFFFEEGKTCVEFQHSYMADDEFEERSAFYNDLGLNTIWLCDLSKSSIIQRADGNYEILEDNSKGFFRISENPENLLQYPVFVQMKDGLIYRIMELKRNETWNEHASTIRYFADAGVYSENEFIDKIINQDMSFQSDVFKSKQKHSIYELWDSTYKCMVVTDDEKTVLLVHDKNGGIVSDLETGVLLYHFVDWYPSSSTYEKRSEKRYRMKYEDAASPKWKLIKGFVKTE